MEGLLGRWLPARSVAGDGPIPVCTCQQWEDIQGAPTLDLSVDPNNSQQQLWGMAAPNESKAAIILGMGLLWAFDRLWFVHWMQLPVDV